MAQDAAAPRAEEVLMTAEIRMVWVIWPDRQEVDVWRRGNVAPVTLRAGDALDGEGVIPGFAYPLTSLFA